MKITINSIEADIKNASVNTEEIYIISGWWIRYEIQLYTPPQTISATLFWDFTPDIQLILKELKHIWKGIEK